VSTFQQCPLRYRYSRIDKIPEPETEAQGVGSMTHEVLERLFMEDAADRTLAKAREILLELWDSEWSERARNLNLSDYNRHMFRWNVWNCVQNYFALEDPREVELGGAEARLEATVNGVPVLGILDRWQSGDDGGVIISDYKTGKVSRKPYDAEKKLQLMVYADLHEAVSGSSVSTAELIYLKGKGTRVRYSFTEDERAATRNTLQDTWAGIQSACDTGVFEAKKTRLCDWCSFKGMCPAWRKNNATHE
jgi:putative RecB family exonuclease